MDDKTETIDALFDAGKLTPDEAERQKKLNEACRYALKDFVGKEMTPTLMAEAEGKLKLAFEEMIRKGTYVLPPGLELDEVELGPDMRIKCYFKKTKNLIVRSAT